MAQLTDLQKLFVEHYLQTWNAAEAARLAGYNAKNDSVYRSIGSENLTKPNIKAEIERRIDQYAMSSNETLQRLSKVARWFDITKYIELRPTHVKDKLGNVFESGVYLWVDLERLQADGLGHLIKRIKQNTAGYLDIEWHDSMKALELIGKTQGIFEDRQEEIIPQESPLLSIPAYLMAPSFTNVYRDIRNKYHTEYVLKGGRGSTKSSFVSLVFIELLVNNPEIHGLATRQVKDTLRDSVYSQLEWAINMLGMEDQFKCTKSPLEMEYLPTGQKIYFRGADDPNKIKSIRPAFGYIGLLWNEELDQYHGEEAIRKIDQSVIRGGEIAYIFRTFNPPKTKNNWANKYVTTPKASMYVHHSDYRDVPVEWLGKPWLDEAEHLKEVNPTAYEHEYLGIANGLGGMVFDNVVIKTITDKEIATFDRERQGLDWGFYPDPAHWGRTYYHAASRTLYIYDEMRKWRTGNRELHDALVNEKGIKPNDMLIADSAEPKSISDFVAYGMKGIRAAEKGPDSVRYGMKWLQ